MIPLSADAPTFLETIDDWVASAVRDGATSFAEVVSCLPGVFPVDVLHSITRTGRFGEIPRNAALRLGQSVIEKSFLAPQSENSILPVPHPLDFEWRFTQEAIEKLAEVAVACGGDVTCLGTPSVFTYFSSIRCAPRSTFIDRNPATLNVLRSRGFGRVVACDCLRDAVPQLKTDVVIADPPWYDEHFKGFLWMTAQVCRMDGFLILSLPPDGMRRS